MKPKKKQTIKVLGKSNKQEAQQTTRLQQLKRALRNVDFGYTIFFSDENGNSVRLYSGATYVDTVI